MKVQKQQPKLNVCPIRVDGGGEYASHEKFLEYLAVEGIIREESAAYTEQEDGISDRCNRTVLDPAPSMLKHTGILNKLWAEVVSTAVYIDNRLASRKLPYSTPFERWTQQQSDISHLVTFGCLAFASTDGDLRNMLDNHAYKCVLLAYSAETLTQYRVMDVNLGRVFIARDVKFVESTLYHQRIKTKSTSFAFEPAKQAKELEIEKPPKLRKAMIQCPKANVLPSKTAVFPRAIYPIYDSDNDVTPPQETPPPELPPRKP
jgi:hypothetical protein